MKTLVALLAALFTTHAMAAAGIPAPSVVKDLLNRPGMGTLRAAQLGTQVVDKKVQVMRATYDFAKKGGVKNVAISLMDVDGKDAVLPKGAIIKRVLVHVITGVTSSGAATVAFGAAAADDLLGATAKASLGADVMADGVPDGTAAKVIALTAAKTLTATIGTANLTAGKIELFVEYYIGG